MTSERDGLKAQYAKAAVRLNEAEEEVRRVSSARLAELMKLPERIRFQHVEDSALTLRDRSSLLHSVAAQLSASKPRALSFGRIAPGRLWRLGRHLSALVIAIVMVAPLGAWIAMAWLNTGDTYVIEHPLHVDWRYPSGEVRPWVIAADTRLVLVHHRGTGAYFRYWIAKQGYARAMVNYVERPR